MVAPDAAMRGRGYETSGSCRPAAEALRGRSHSYFSGSPSVVLILLNLLSGVALLVWGSHIVRTGVLRVLGADLRAILGRSTGGRLRAFLTGIGVTSLVQSSNATAVIITSFVAQGLISLAGGLTVMLGGGRRHGSDGPRAHARSLLAIATPDSLWCTAVSHTQAESHRPDGPRDHRSWPDPACAASDCGSRATHDAGRRCAGDVRCADRRYDARRVGRRCLCNDLLFEPRSGLAHRDAGFLGRDLTEGRAMSGGRRESRQWTTGAV